MLKLKCREYEVMLKKRRDAGGKMRPPMAWWQYGCKDDFEKRLPDIKREFPKQDDAHILYWDAHGPELPYAVVDDKGKSIADQAVTTITFREANEFAGWVGMRLPSEAEWTRAARGDGTQVWPVAAANPWRNAALPMSLANCSSGAKPWWQRTRCSRPGRGLRRRTSL